jgi:uncharacterized membrane protein YidH (DUF202 family)
VVSFFLAEWLDRKFPSAPPIAVGGGNGRSLAMKTTILAYVIALGGVAMIALGLWSLYVLITERVTELRLRDYIPTIQTIAVGLVLIGLAQALRLSLLIWEWVTQILSRLVA